MSTNYYVRLNACISCNRYDSVHIGKRFEDVKDRRFLVEIHSEHYTTESQFMGFLAAHYGSIYDEYDNKIRFDEFCLMIGRLSVNKPIESSDIVNWQYVDCSETPFS